MSLSLFSFLGHPRADLSAFIDGQLSTERTAAIDVHVSRCASCRSEVDGLLETRAALATLPQANAPRSFALTPQQVAQPARPSLQRPQPVGPAFFGMRIASAGLAVALALVFVADLGDGGSDNTSRDASEDAALQMTSIAEDAAGGDMFMEGDSGQPMAEKTEESSGARPGSLDAPDDTAQPADGGNSGGTGGGVGSAPTPTLVDGAAPEATDLALPSPTLPAVAAVVPTDTGDPLYYDRANDSDLELTSERVATDALTGDGDDGLSALQIAQIVLAATLAVAMVGGFLLPLAFRNNR